MYKVINKYKFPFLVLTVILYFPIFFATAEHSSPLLFDLITPYTTVLVVNMLSIFFKDNPLLVVISYHFASIIFSILFSAVIIYLWFKIVVPFKKVKITLSLIILLFIMYNVYNFIGMFFGFGLSFPPNKCDLQLGYPENTGDLLSKRFLCLSELAEESKNPRLCKYLGTYKTGCIKNIAKKSKDPVICNKLEKTTTRNTCITEVASLKSDSGICNLIKDGSAKVRCQRDINDLADGEIRYTGKITDFDNGCIGGRGICRLKIDHYWVAIKEINDREFMQGSHNFNLNADKSVYIGKSAEVFGKIIDENNISIYGIGFGYFVNQL